MTDRTNPMTTDAMLKLAARCEQATGPDRDIALDKAIALGIGFLREPNDFVTPYSSVPPIPAYTASLDAAMTLVPETFANLDIFSFIGEHKPSWGCRFHDTSQLMGERAAREEIARMNKEGVFGRQLRGAPRLVMEKAIAEHFIEFHCLGAATPALALCAAALKAKASQ